MVQFNMLASTVSSSLIAPGIGLISLLYFVMQGSLELLGRRLEEGLSWRAFNRIVTHFNISELTHANLFLSFLICYPYYLASLEYRLFIVFSNNSNTQTCVLKVKNSR